jgi:IS1 family transposase
MANNLPMEKQVSVISALAEGASIRATERMFGVHRDTIMRLGVRVGQGCERLLDSIMRDMTCARLQVDEIWGYVGRHQRYVTSQHTEFSGDAWTFIAIDADTKVVPCFRVGKRDAETANAFVMDLSNRLVNRVQLSSDGLAAYLEAVELSFGSDVDYGQIVKTFSTTDPLPSNRRYSPPPDIGHISTSYIEKQNLTVRTHVRRLTRLTNAFSKKLENFKAAMALHFGYYNLVKFHGTIRMPPALKAKVVSSPWTTAELVDAALKA